MINIADFYEDMKELRAQMSKREKPFNDLIDFGWALEQGVDKGYHCHLVLFLMGTLSRMDGVLLIKSERNGRKSQAS